MLGNTTIDVNAFVSDVCQSPRTCANLKSTGHDEIFILHKKLNKQTLSIHVGHLAKTEL